MLLGNVGGGGGRAPMKRTPFRRSKPKPHPKGPKPLVPKDTGRRIDGGKLAHRRSATHLVLVRAQPCLVSRRLGPGVVAHHPDEVFPDLLKQGGKISDFLAVPIAHELHDPGHPGSLHKSNSAAWWAGHGVNPLRWLLIFLRRHYKPGQNEGADEAVAMVQRRIEMNAEISASPHRGNTRGGRHQ